MLRNQLIALRSSDAVDVMFANPVTGTVEILFMTGHAYKFKNVSRRAIFKFIIDDARSIGKFINNVLKSDDVKCVQLASMPQFVLG